MTSPFGNLRWRRLEPWLVALILLLAASLRLWDLGADPPVDLAESTGVYTDPSQYTLYARYFAEQGKFNPFEDYRQPFFLSSSMTALAALVFKTVGTGLSQSNLAGVLFSFGALVLFWLFVRRAAGLTAGLIFLVTIAVNYNLTFFGRLPFLENAMMFWASLALVLVTYYRRSPLMVAAGVSLGIGIFYGKVIGLIFVFPFAVLFVYNIAVENTPVRRMNLMHAVWFSAGFAFLTLVWVVSDYLTAPDQVTGYIGEQAYGLYGWPDGLKSLDEFLRAMVSFGITSLLFERMPLMALTTLALIGIVCFHVVRRQSWRLGFGSLDGGHVFLAAMIAAFFGSLMIWNYRPLRYQLPLIYACYAGAATILSMMISRWREGRPIKMTWPAFVLWLPAMFVAVMQVLMALGDAVGFDFNYVDHKITGLILAAMIMGASAWAVSSYHSVQTSFARNLARWTVVVIVGVTVGQGVYRYAHWRERVSYTINDNAHDLDGMLNDGAVLSGPYGPTLALANDRPAVIHMFGGNVDTTLFDRFPITHLLLDLGNERQAKEQYPQVMERATHICTYHVGQEKVRLFRIAGLTGNIRSRAYQPSVLEQATDLLRAGNLPGAAILAGEYNDKYPDNITANLLMADIAENTKDIDLAEEYVKKAVEFSPTNYNLNAVLGLMYKSRYEMTGLPSYKQQAIDYFQTARKFAPSAAKVTKSLAELESTQ
ncbi:MAG: hypothetical protein ABIE70_13125 [bacterium]